MNEFYSIVLLGNMNPAIHHPTWYLNYGIISEDDAKMILENEDTKTIYLKISTLTSQFSFNEIVIECDLQRWVIRTASKDKLDQIQYIASKMIEILYHTPITAFGFNFWVSLKQDRDMQSWLNNKIDSNGLGINSDNINQDVPFIRFKSPRYGYAHQAELAINSNNGTMEIRNNFHYMVEKNPLISLDQRGQFPLENLLKEQFTVCKNEANQYINKIIKETEK